MITTTKMDSLGKNGATKRTDATTADKKRLSVKSSLQAKASSSTKQKESHNRTRSVQV